MSRAVRAAFVLLLAGRGCAAEEEVTIQSCTASGGKCEQAYDDMIDDQEGSWYHEYVCGSSSWIEFDLGGVKAIDRVVLRGRYRKGGGYIPLLQETSDEILISGSGNPELTLQDTNGEEWVDRAVDFVGQTIRFT
ncbi:unnamed protein product [Prorocentrum cordatum]|uniref:F5/8 type C domain-containing protein n=1 Tax=Prorocentrum cordatum TaxID=2364126 RepID=A0ABN9T2A2_9DINO|nr:unnamed protein product [Polarella glacialis]